MRKVAGVLVTIYANRLYDKAARAAERRHEREGGRIHVISSILDDTKLAVCDRGEFRAAKRKLGINDPRMSAARMAEGAWYYTADRGGNAMPAREREVRRLAFARCLLRRARLV